jgi:hypothetical protein|tara:strand:+ start:490 stop:600 length:111 start_codon:yes stop_codon:yes gene_type:complete
MKVALLRDKVRVKRISQVWRGKTVAATIDGLWVGHG